MLFQPRYFSAQVTVAAVMLLECLCGTVKSEGPSESLSIASASVAEHEQIRQRTTTKFMHAAYYSPVHDQELGRTVWMAPLIVQELHWKDGQPELLKFGEVRETETGQSVIEEDRPTVYTTARRIRIGGRLYQQDTYVWFYPPAEIGGPLRYRGFRQTLGQNGFPVVREIISDASTQRIFFVGKSLESAAALQSGSPLNDRRFSVEPDHSKHSDVVVARVLPDGPQPMGPYVYVDSASLGISNLMCRCEPSQADEFALQRQYRLVTVTSFAKLNLNLAGPKDGALPDATQLDGILRLPESL